MILAGEGFLAHAQAKHEAMQGNRRMRLARIYSDSGVPPSPEYCLV
jgi:hypothetical protein